MGAIPAKEVAALVSEQTATLALELDKSASQQARLADENASLKQSIERQRQQVTDLEQMLDARADTIKTTTARLTGCAQDYAAAKANLGRRNAAVEAAERGRAHAQKEGARLRAAASAAEAASATTPRAPVASASPPPLCICPSAPSTCGGGCRCREGDPRPSSHRRATRAIGAEPAAIQPTPNAHGQCGI